jgi:hypothetical protein
MAAPATPRSSAASARRKTRAISRRPRPRVRVTTVRRSRRKFLRYYPGGFKDTDYLKLERGYKWTAHERWIEALGRDRFRVLLEAENFGAIAQGAVSIESRTNLLFSFEKMALRDAVKSAASAETFAKGLWRFLHGDATLSERFDAWLEVLSSLPRRQTRVLTWPLATVFGFIAQPRLHLFVKPMVTRRAAQNYGYALEYRSQPDWPTYSGFLGFARAVRADIRDLRPRDMIDIQSFIWVQGSDEYPN